MPGRKSDTAREGAPMTTTGEIAELLDSLATASTSATWKCRHASGSVDRKSVV